MKIALTGATGFVGRYIASRLTGHGHDLRCWYRPTSFRDDHQLRDSRIRWVPGELNDPASIGALVEGCDGVVHAALDRPGRAFQGGEGDLIMFAQTNVIGTLRLIEAARQADVERFVLISTCAVHDVILEDRPVDETHPLWPASHYGADKAALESFVHSFGFGDGYAICACATGVYGVNHPVENSKWFALVRSVVRGQTVHCRGGGKEVHAADVARATELLLKAERHAIAGQAFNCYDRYVSQYQVATLAQQLCGSRGEIGGQPTAPKHQIETTKLRALGMQFGGDELLRQTIAQLVESARHHA